MGITEIYKRLSPLLMPAITAIVIALIFIALYYFLYYKKRQSKGLPRTQMKQLVFSVLLIGYVVVLLEITCFGGRIGSGASRMNLHLFSDYLEAWNSYSLKDLQLNIFNIMLFIPMGILLPLVSKKLKAFRWLLPVVFSSTLLIETFQLVTGRGVFELDDLFNNTVGGIIGYQLYRLAASIVHHKKLKVKSLLGNLAIPLLMALLFVGMNTVYNLQEFGNMSLNSYSRWNMSNVKLTTSLQLSSAPLVSPVYKKTIEKDNGWEVAKMLQQKLGLTELTAEDKDETLFSYKDKSGSQYTLSLSTDGSWFFNEDNYSPDTSENNEQLVEKAKALLADLDLLPKEAQLTNMENGKFYWTIPQVSYLNKDFWDGFVLIGLKKDGSVYSLTNFFTNYKFIQEVDIISPAEVYKRIKQGEFRVYNNKASVNRDQLVIKKGDQLVITNIELSYMYDTKEFYQPVYRVSGILNGDSDWFTLIEARRH